MVGAWRGQKISKDHRHQTHSNRQPQTGPNHRPQVTADDKTEANPEELPVIVKVQAIGLPLCLKSAAEQRTGA